MLERYVSRTRYVMTIYQTLNYITDFHIFCVVTFSFDSHRNHSLDVIILCSKYDFFGNDIEMKCQYVHVLEIFNKIIFLRSY